jgi:hypothetical protein
MFSDDSIDPMNFRPYPAAMEPVTGVAFMAVGQ